MTDADDQAATRADIEQRDKEIENLLKARAVRAGYVLTRSLRDDGSVSFIASRWGLLRDLPDLAAVEHFLRQIGAR